MKRLVLAAAVAGAALVPTLAAGSAQADPVPSPPPVVQADRDNNLCIANVGLGAATCIDAGALNALLEQLLHGQQAFAQGLTL